MSSLWLPERIHLDKVIEQAPSDPGVMVYFLHEDPATSRFKVGFTVRGPDVRAHELALGNSQLRLWCHMPGSKRLECLLKGRFMKDSVDGREIFHTHPWKTYIERLTRLRGGKL